MKQTESLQAYQWEYASAVLELPDSGKGQGIQLYYRAETLGMQWSEEVEDKDTWRGFYCFGSFGGALWRNF